MSEAPGPTPEEIQPQLENIEDNGGNGYEEILSKEFESGELPDAIFVLQGGYEKHPRKEGEYRSPSYASGDHAGITGSRARVIAAAEIAKAHPEITIVATSQGEQEGKEFAGVMEAELKERGVNPISETKSASTLTELLELVKISKEKGWNNVAVLTNGYHVPRTRVMYQRLETIEGLCSEDEVEMIRDFKKSGVQVSFISAEDILSETSPHYKNLIKKVEETEAYQDRVKSEQKGIEDLEAGRYKVRRQQ